MIRQIALLRTRHYGCAFYITWFHKCYAYSDTGWGLVRTPDGKPIVESDAFFIRAMEVIAQTANIMVGENRNR